jgi:hypothetical protein
LEIISWNELVWQQLVGIIGMEQLAGITGMEMAGIPNSSK